MRSEKKNKGQKTNEKVIHPKVGQIWKSDRIFTGAKELFIVVLGSVQGRLTRSPCIA